MRSPSNRIDESRDRVRSGFGIRALVPALFICMLAVSFSDRRTGTGVGSTSEHESGPGRALLQALVVPQLSAPCLSAIGDAFRTCTSPGPGGIVSCTVSLIRILESCP